MALLVVIMTIMALLVVIMTIMALLKIILTIIALLIVILKTKDAAGRNSDYHGSAGRNSDYHGAADRNSDYHGTAGPNSDVVLTGAEKEPAHTVACLVTMMHNVCTVLYAHYIKLDIVSQFFHCNHKTAILYIEPFVFFCDD